MTTKSLMPRLLLSTLAALLLAAAPARADDKTYAIQINHPFTVGTHFALTAKSSLSQSTRIATDGAETKNESHEARYELEAALTVTGIDDKGRENQLHLVIKKCTAVLDAAPPSNLLEPGDEIDCTYKNAKAEFSRTAAPLPDPVLKALHTLLIAPKEKTNDDLLGAADKKKIGDSWNIHPEALIADLAQAKIKVDPKNITGTVKLTDTPTLANIPCLTLDVQTKITGLSPEIPTKPTECTVTVTGTIQIPLDPANPSAFVRESATTHALYERKDKDKTILYTVDDTHTHEQSLILNKESPTTVPATQPQK